MTYFAIFRDIIYVLYPQQHTTYKYGVLATPYRAERICRVIVHWGNCHLQTSRCEIIMDSSYKLPSGDEGSSLYNKK